MCRAFPLLFVEKQRLCTFYNERERFLHRVINHLILAEDYEETVESDRKNGRNTASEDRIFREEKCRHVKFRKKIQTVANGPDSCYLKKEIRNDAKERRKRAFKTKIRHIRRKLQQETAAKCAGNGKNATQRYKKYRADDFRHMFSIERIPPEPLK